MNLERFQKDLLEALQHLYDPSWLHDNAVLEILPVEDHSNLVAGFQRLICDAIQAMRPDTSVPPQSDAWRAYYVLVYRFIEGSSQRVVAVNMALSERQLRREEHQAIHLLGDTLWKRYNLDQEESKNTQLNIKTEYGARDNEMNWLKQSQPYETTAIKIVFDSALRTTAELIKIAGLQVELDIPENLPLVTGQIGVLRQALVNLFSAAAQPMGWTYVLVAARDENQALTLCFTAECACVDNEQREPIEMVVDLVELFGGTMITETGAGTQIVKMSLPVRSGIPVLLVDDNADAHQLIQRCLTGSPYRYIGTSDPNDVIRLAEEQHPRVVLLDIMLPGRDGWEILALLRENPATSRIPVVICTILPQEKLALSLGAAGFLRKPIMQETLLRTLESLMGQL